MDFELPSEYQMIKDTVHRFVKEELITLEPAVLAREAKEGVCKLTLEEKKPLLEKCKELGLWGLDVPEEYDGMNLPAIAMVGVNEAIGSTPVPFTFPPDSPNLHMLIETANEIQREKYLMPYARGEMSSAIAISEPGAGADPSSMSTKAIRDGSDWVLNGRKIWITRADEADFTILIAVTDSSKGTRGGMSAFIIDKEVKLIISECYKKATEILNKNLENLHLMAASLVEYETLDSAQIDDIMAGAKPRAPGSKEDKTKSKEKNDPSVGDAAEQS